MRKIEAHYLAKQLETEDTARVHIGLKMSEVSARELGKAEEDRKKKTKDKTAREDDARHEALGRPIKRAMRWNLEFDAWADVKKAPYVRHYGWPGQTAEERAEPLEGVSSSMARTIQRLNDKRRFGESFMVFWVQMDGDPDANMWQRLEATAKGE